MPRLRRLPDPTAGSPMPRPEPDRLRGQVPRVSSPTRRPGTNGTQDVGVAVFDPRCALSPAAGRASRQEEVGPVLAHLCDRLAERRVWACYYDSSGDHERKHAWFSCTSSRDGGAGRRRYVPRQTRRMPESCGRTRASSASETPAATAAIRAWRSRMGRPSAVDRHAWHGWGSGAEIYGSPLDRAGRPRRASVGVARGLALPVAGPTSAAPAELRALS